MPVTMLFVAVHFLPYATSITVPNQPQGDLLQGPWLLDKSNKLPKANVHWNVIFSDMRNTEKLIAITKQKNPNISTVANVHWGQVRLVDSSSLPIYSLSLTSNRVDSPCLHVRFFWPVRFLCFDKRKVRSMVMVASAMMLVIICDRIFSRKSTILSSIRVVFFVSLYV